MKIDFSKPSGPLLGLLCIIVFLIGCLIITFLFQDGQVIGTYGVSKTVGWAWDICNLLPAAVMASTVIIFFGYLILWLCEARVNKIVSITNLILVIVSMLSLFLNTLNICMVLFGIAVLSVLMVFVNIGFAIANAVAAKRNHTT
jgi:hypothetical protein